MVLVLALAATATWLLFFSAVLAAQEVVVHGAETVAVSQVRAAAAVRPDEPLSRVDLDAVEARVEALAIVAGAEVSRQWPDRVLVIIEERVAIAVIEIAGRIRGMDATGVVFRDYDRAPAGLPRVQTTTGTTADALAEAAQVVSALPSTLVPQVDHVEVETVDQISLVLRDGRLVRWGSAEESQDKARVLAALLEEPARIYDVSVPGQPTTSG